MKRALGAMGRLESSWMRGCMWSPTKPLSVMRQYEMPSGKFRAKKSAWRIAGCQYGIGLLSVVPGDFLNQGKLLYTFTKAPCPLASCRP